MNGDLFLKWVKDQLVPALFSLKIKCTIVMDNAPYHSVKINKPPTTSSRKKDIQNWLRNQNISLEDSLKKKNNFCDW
jgi:hypothetical protein